MARGYQRALGGYSLSAHTLVLALSNFDGASEVTYPDLFHIGFRQDDDASVDAIYERLRGDGIEVGERQDEHGAWTFYFTAPGGFLIEVSHQRPNE